MMLFLSARKPIVPPKLIAALGNTIRSSTLLVWDTTTTNSTTPNPIIARRHRHYSTVPPSVSRQFSSPAVITASITAPSQHDHAVSSLLSDEPVWMQDVIHKMMVEHNKPLVAGGSGSNEAASPCVRDLEKSLQSLKNQLVEAELCIQDCHECRNDTERATEIASAVVAVDEAVASFVDLLDDSRNDPNQGNGGGGKPKSPSQSLSSSRIQTEELVQRIKQLRRDIVQLKSMATAKSSATATQSSA